MTIGVTRRSALFSIALCAALCLPAPALAQESVTATLLARAKNAFNDFKFSEADSIARLLLGLGDVVPKTERVSALQIAAAARYPDDVSLRRPNAALEALRAIVALGHTDPIPFEIGSAGLDSLYVSVGGTARGSGARPAAAAATAADGPTLAETAAWLQDRLPEFTGVAWRDSSEFGLSTAFERYSLVEINRCTIRYRVYHQEDDILVAQRNKKTTFKWDSTYVFEARYLDERTFKSGTADLAIRLFGVLRGSVRTPAGFVSVIERPVPGKAPRRIEWTLKSGAQAGRVHSALERLVLLCQKEPF
jgi:hypothetical protein